MRWLTTKVMFGVWLALILADAKDRRVFLGKLIPLIEEAKRELQCQ